MLLKAKSVAPKLQSGKKTPAVAGTASRALLDER
jgi:hypothetical protein